MSQPKYRILAASVAVLAVSTHTTVAQTVLFSDSFDRVSGTPDEDGQIEGEPNPLASTSWGDNDNALGGVVTQTYEIGPDIRAGNRHQYVDGDVARFRTGWAEIQHDFAPQGATGDGLIIEFDATIKDATNGWLAFALGQSEAESTDEGDNNSVFLMVEDTVDFGVLFGGINGSGVSTALEIFEGDDFPAPFDPAFQGDWGFGSSPNTEQTFRIEIASDDFGVDGANAVADIFVTHPTFGERQVLSNFAFDWDADGEVYIAFSSNKDQGCGPAGVGDCDETGQNPAQEVEIDNLVISTINTIDLGPTLMADFNGDGTVDLLDLDILGANFGGPGGLAMGDANDDGNVDLLDLDILGSEFGMSAGSSAAVPEPTTGVLALGSVAALALCRRRRV